MVTPEGYKLCSRCERSLLAREHFYTNKGKRSDGYSGYCKPCTKAKVVEWQKANPDKKAAQDRKQQARPTSRVKKSERERRRRAANPEAEAARVAAWNLANPEMSRARSYRWRAANLDRAREIQRKHHWHGEGRRERVLDHIRLRHAFLKDKEINGDDGRKLNRSVWLAILAAFDNRCCYCDSPDEITIEHLTAIRRGGRNELGNIAPACATCNKRKKAKSAEQFCPTRAAEIRRKAMICEVVAQAA